jgi:uncharacterized membrane protein
MLSYTYRDVSAENLFNIFSFVYSSQPIRLCVSFLHVWEKRYVQSEAISCVTKWLLFTELRNLGMYKINRKHHGKCFVQFLSTCYNLWIKTVRSHFPWSNLYLLHDIAISECNTAISECKYGTVLHGCTRSLFELLFLNHFRCCLSYNKQLITLKVV